MSTDERNFSTSLHSAALIEGFLKEREDRNRALFVRLGVHRCEAEKARLRVYLIPGQTNDFSRSHAGLIGADDQIAQMRSGN